MEYGTDSSNRIHNEDADSGVVGGCDLTILLIAQLH